MPLAARFRRGARQRLGHQRRGLRRRDGLYHRLLTLLDRLGVFAKLRLLGLLDQLVARRHVLHLVQFVVRRRCTL